LRHWAEGTRLFLVAARDGADLVGLAPLVLRRRGPFRVLTELGKEPGNYWDVLSRPGREGEVAAAVTAEIGRRAREWDAVALRALPQGSAIETALAARGMRIRSRPPAAHPGIELPATFDEYLARLPSKRRKDLRRHLRQLDEGELSYSVVERPSDLERAIADWQSLRVRWWEARGRRLDPEHASPRFRAFLLDAMPRLVPAGLAEVWEFRRGGAVVGIEISLTDPRRFYAWLDGYDPDAAALGLGKVAVAEGIRTSIAAGRSYFDFMVGDEPYKYWYGAEDRHRRWLLATGTHMRSRLAGIAGAAASIARRAL
jgi:CelD/BcsL family acetyltransferase involved in cellulose biosynthesis